MTVRRLSTLTFARRLAAHLPDGQKLLQALHRPQVADILETLDRHDHGRFFILGPFQVVKSLIGQLHLARNHWIHPVKAGWYGPTDKFQAEFYRGKLEPLLKASPDLALCKYLKPGAKIYHASARTDPPPPKKGFDTVADQEFGERPWINQDAVDSNRYTVGRHTYTEGGTHSLLSAATEPDRTGRTLQHIYLDEVHLWKPGWIKQVSNRRADFIDSENWKEIYMSTGLNRDDEDGGEATKIWDTTTRHLWHVRCPNCQKYSPDRFLHREKEDDKESPLTGGYFYDRILLENGTPNQAAIAHTLRWVCPLCSVPDPTPGARRYSPRCSLPDTQASRELLSGTFEHPIGQYVQQNPTPYAASHGWNFTALTVRAWIDVVLNWENAQLARARGSLDDLAKVIREDLAGIWHPLKEMKDTRLRPKGGYPMADLTKWGRTPIAA